MNARIKQLWIDALRSGSYIQTFHRFRKYLKSINEPVYCAGGVLMDIYMKDVKPIRHWNNMPLEVLEWAELPYKDDGYDMSHIVLMNDEDKKPFSEIADFIEEHF